ncbi:MAG: hypothetical protein M3378_12225 [Actinomycetota bacterium]|nr:hypothetical protein [Actinomycetota bacterium]
MILWWIANAVLILVVAPVVVWLANKLLRPTFEIRAYADDILEHGVALTGTLDAVPKLLTTRDLVAEARQGVTRYGSALQRMS